MLGRNSLERKRRRSGEEKAAIVIARLTRPRFRPEVGGLLFLGKDSPHAFLD